MLCINNSRTEIKDKLFPITPTQNREITIVKNLIVILSIICTSILYYYIITHNLGIYILYLLHIIYYIYWLDIFTKWLIQYIQFCNLLFFSHNNISRHLLKSRFGYLLHFKNDHIVFYCMDVPYFIYLIPTDEDVLFLIFAIMNNAVNILV